MNEMLGSGGIPGPQGAEVKLNPDRILLTWVLGMGSANYWRRQWHSTLVFLPGESQEWGSLVGCRLWGRTESDTTEAMTATAAAAAAGNYSILGCWHTEASQIQGDGSKSVRTRG